MHQNAARKEREKGLDFLPALRSLRIFLRVIQVYVASFRHKAHYAQAQPRVDFCDSFCSFSDVLQILIFLNVQIICRIRR